MSKEINSSENLPRPDILTTGRILRYPLAARSVGGSTQHLSTRLWLKSPKLTIQEAERLLELMEIWPDERVDDYNKRRPTVIREINKFLLEKHSVYIL